MLHLLEHLVCDFDEPYVGMIWQLLCGPFTPFLELFGEIVSKGKEELPENEEALLAMEKLPIYLRNMSLRSSLATRLERIAIVFVKHAKSMMHSQGT